MWSHESVMMGRIRNFFRRQLGGSYSVESSNYKVATYQHDQCERSLGMHLYSMEKRDLTLVAILFILLSALCFILAELAPKSHVLDTILLGSSVISLKSKQQGKLYSNELPKFSYLTDSGDDDSNSIAIENNNGKQQQQQQEEQDPPEYSGGETRSSFEISLTTKPLNSLNRGLNLLGHFEFGFLRSAGEAKLLNDASMNISYRIGWQLKPLKQSSMERQHRESVLGMLITSSDRFNGQQNTLASSSVSKQVSSNNIRSPVEGASFRGQTFQHLDVTFNCRIISNNERLTSLIFGPRLNQTNSTSGLIKCDAPDLITIHRIEHMKKYPYQLTMVVHQVKYTTLLPDIYNETTRAHENSVKFTFLPSSASNETSNLLGLLVTLSYTNSSFSLLTIFTRLLFLLISSSVTCSFIICLSKHQYKLWSLEQKWTTLMLVLLVGANRPMYTLEFLMPLAASGSLADQEAPEAMPQANFHEQQQQQQAKRFTSGSRNPVDLFNSILDLTFLCGLLLSWPCFAHSIRQMSRPFVQFYSVKFALVSLIWLLAMLAILDVNNQLKNQMRFVQFVDLNAIFGGALGAYFVNLLYHFTMSAVELRPMSYFTLRFRAQSLLCASLLLTYSAIIFMDPVIHTPAEMIDSSAAKEIYQDWNSWEKQVHSYASDTDSQQEHKYEAESSMRAKRRPSVGLKSSAEAQINGGLDYIGLPMLRLLPQFHAFDSACAFLCLVLINNLYVLTCAYLYWPVVHHAPMALQPTSMGQFEFE